MTDNDNGERPRNKNTNKTTVSDFVTHEPYDRQSSTQRKKYSSMKRWQRSRQPAQTVSNGIESDQSGTAETTKHKSSVRQTGQGRETERQDQTARKEFEHACEQGRRDQKLINLDPKEAVMSFVQGHIANLKNQAISAVKSFFQF